MRGNGVNHFEYFIYFHVFPRRYNAAGERKAAYLNVGTMLHRLDGSVHNISGYSKPVHRIRYERCVILPELLKLFGRYHKVCMQLSVPQQRNMLCKHIVKLIGSERLCQVIVESCIHDQLSFGFKCVRRYRNNRKMTELFVALNDLQCVESVHLPQQVDVHQYNIGGFLIEQPKCVFCGGGGADFPSAPVQYGTDICYVLEIIFNDKRVATFSA